MQKSALRENTNKMLVKFLKAKYGDGHGAVNYCLNQRVNQGTARILKGDEQVTRAIISNMAHKNKVEFGVLSFENGAKITEKQKHEIMADFENMLLGNMKERVNILWVEHTDKGRLELNFIIPKIDLESGKAFTPYFYAYRDEKRKKYNADAMKVNLWVEKTNYFYGLEHPNDPRKSKAVSTSPTHKQFKTIDELDEHLHFMVDNELLNSRAEIIDYITNDLNLTIKTRKDGTYPKDYLAIKLDDTNDYHRLKSSREGQIYNERFTNQAELAKLNGEVETRINKFINKNAEIVISDNERRITALVEARNSYNQRRYFKTNTRNNQHDRADIRSEISEVRAGIQNEIADARTAEPSDREYFTTENRQIPTNDENLADIAISDRGSIVEPDLFISDFDEVERGENDEFSNEANQRVSRIRENISEIERTLQPNADGERQSNQGTIGNDTAKRQRDFKIAINARAGIARERRTNSETRTAIKGQRAGISETRTKISGDRARIAKQRNDYFATMARNIAEAIRKRKLKAIAEAVKRRIADDIRERGDRIIKCARQAMDDFYGRIRSVRKRFTDEFEKITGRFNAIRERRAERERQRLEIERQKASYVYRTHNLQFDIEVIKLNGRYITQTSTELKLKYCDIDIKTEYELNNDPNLKNLKSEYKHIDPYRAMVLQDLQPKERYNQAHKFELYTTQTIEQAQKIFDSQKTQAQQRADTLNAEAQIKKNSGISMGY